MPEREEGAGKLCRTGEEWSRHDRLSWSGGRAASRLYMECFPVQHCDGRHSLRMCGWGQCGTMYAAVDATVGKSREGIEQRLGELRIILES